MARRTPLNDVIPFDKNITFHKLVAWSIVFFSWVHTIAHWNNLAKFSADREKSGYDGGVGQVRSALPLAKWIKGISSSDGLEDEQSRAQRAKR